MTSPVRVSSAVSGTFSTASTAQSVAGVVVQVGDVVVVTMTTASECPGSMPTAAGLTFTLAQESCMGYPYGTSTCWTAIAASASTQTVTLNPWSSSSWGFTVTVWRGSPGVGASAKGNASDTTAPHLDLTTVSADSAVCVAIDNLDGTSGAGRAWLAAGSAFVETAYFMPVGVDDYGTHYHGYYPNIGSSGAKTLGLSAPAGIPWSMAAVEVRGVAGVEPPPVSGSTFVGWGVPVGLTVVALVAPAFTSSAAPATATVGVFYSFTFTASGPSVTFSVASGSLPAGLTMTSVGVMSGTPTGAVASTFTIAATNTTGTVTVARTITVSLPASGGSPTWNGGFQTSLLTGWQAEQQICRPAQQAIVTTPVRAGFAQSARFICADGDDVNQPGRDRSEVYTSIANAGTPAQGQVMWWGYSIYIAAGFQVDSNAESPVGNGWCILTQWHADDGASPVIDFGMTKGTATPSMIVSTDGVDGGHEWIMPTAFPLGRWVDMRVGITWGETASTGRLTVRQDGSTILNSVACGNMHSGLSGYFKQGIYRAASPRTHTIYYSGTRRGPTEASVTY